MSYPIKDIQGIGPVYADKLAAAKIETTDDLLAKCCNPAGRKATAAATGLDEKLLLKWSNLADLMRISGVGPQFSELLEGAGVDTVKELRNRNAENLAKAMGEVNERKRLAKTAPAATSVEKWIAAAKNLEPKITY